MRLIFLFNSVIDVELIKWLIEWMIDSFFKNEGKRNKKFSDRWIRVENKLSARSPQRFQSDYRKQFFKFTVDRLLNWFLPKKIKYI